MVNFQNSHHIFYINYSSKDNWHPKFKFSLQMERSYNFFPTYGKGCKFMAYPIYVDVNFQGHKIMHPTASWTLMSGGPWFVFGNGNEDLSNKHELTKIDKLSDAMGFLWWTTSPPPNLKKFHVHNLWIHMINEGDYFIHFVSQNKCKL